MGGSFVVPKVDVGGREGDIRIGVHPIVGKVFVADEVRNLLCGLRLELRIR